MKPLPGVSECVAPNDPLYEDTLYEDTMMKILLGLLAAILFMSGPALAETLADLKAGTDYELIEPPQPTANPAKVEVKEFFSYGCPHCYQFEPYLNGWLKKKPESVDFIRQPVTFGRPQWATLARMYFTADALGVLDKIHGDVYKALYDDKQSLETDDEVAKFFADHGVPEPEFAKVYKSFSVDMKVKQADGVVNAYKKVTGTPTVVVNGKYVVRGNYDRVFAIVDALVQSESAALRGPAAKH